MAQTFDPGQLKVSLAAKLKAAADEGPFGAEAKRRGFTSGPDLWAIAGSSIVDAIIAIVEHMRPQQKGDPDEPDV